MIDGSKKYKGHSETSWVMVPRGTYSREVTNFKNLPVSVVNFEFDWSLKFTNTVEFWLF